MEKSRINKIKHWFKDPYNLALVGILVFAFCLRLYYFILTKNQPLWYDEADYMNIARYWAKGHPHWTFSSIRPPLFPLVLAILMKFGFTEFSIKVLIALTSLMGIFLTYKLGSFMFNKFTGLVGSFILTIFWSFNFYSYRILVDVPLLALWVVTIYHFLKARKTNTFKDNLLFFFFASISFLFKYTSAILIIVIGLYFITVENFKILKDKKFLIGSIPGFLILFCFLIFEWIKFGSPIAFLTKGLGTRSYERPFLISLWNQTKLIFTMHHSILMWLSILGIIFMVYKTIVAWKLALKKESKYNKYYFNLLLFFVSILIFGALNYGAYMEERYYFPFLPAIYFSIGELLNQFKKREYLTIVGIAVCILFSIAAYQNLTHGNTIIKYKLHSFEQLKYTGESIKSQLKEDESFMATQELAELVYYSQRNGISIPKNETQVEDLIKNYNIKYYILVLWYPPFPQWWIKYPIENNLTLVKYYTPFIDKDNRLPIVSIFKF